MKNNSQIVIYKDNHGQTALDVKISGETIWLSQKQIADLFACSTDNVALHLKNIYKEQELDEKATTEDSSAVQIEGKRKVNRPVCIYNLDAIISVGYRINSKRATQFRQWATKTLRQHITKGYTINKKRVNQNLDKFLKAVNEVKLLLPAESNVDMREVLNLVSSFAKTWLSLEAYDSAKLPASGFSEKEVLFTAEELTGAIFTLRKELITKKSATELFAAERSHHGIHGIVGNVFQSFAGEDLYKTVEEKAAHLLYFIVKDHPFTDGNKRSGAFAFIWYLQKSGLLNPLKLTPETLTALTLLVAESSPKDKDRMIGLVLLLLRK